MNPKDYREMPDAGLFEKIQHRLKVRRAMRVGGAAVAAVLIAATAVVLFWPRETQEAASVAMRQEIQSPTASPAVVADETAVQPSEVPAIATQVAEGQADIRPAAEQAAAPTVAADPEDDPAWFAAMLPQGSPVVARLDEPAETSVTGISLDIMDNHGADGADGLPVAKSEPSKAGQPVTHFDNVIWAPNLIVPDGEVDENRVFSIKSTSTFTNFKLHIYNRNGRRIFLTTDPAFVWDATIEGTRVPQGAYVWVATFRDSDGNPRQEQGTVTVVR